MDMEARDVNYILPAYVRVYLFESKNEDPEKIIFPMFTSVPHPTKRGVMIPIEWVPPLDPVAIEIADDGKDVAEVTPEEEAELDEKDELVKQLRKEISSLGDQLSIARLDSESNQQSRTDAADTPSTSEAVPPAYPDRVPNQPPGGDIGPGTPLSDMHQRDAADLPRTKLDLTEGPDVDEYEEKPFEKEVSRDSEGNPVVEDNSASS